MPRLLTLLVAFIVGLSQGAHALDLLDQLQLRGPVKTYLFKSFWAQEDPSKSGWSGRRDFDARGRLTYYCTFNPDGSVREETSWRYVLDGNRITSVVQLGRSPSETVYRYDEAGRLSLTEARSAVGQRLVSRYDSEGSAVSSELILPDGSVQARTLTTYSPDKRTAKTETFDASGKRLSTREVTTTPEGRSLASKTSPIQGSKVIGSFVSVTNEYDSRGLLVARSMLDSEGLAPSECWKYEYDGFDRHGNYATARAYERTEPTSDFQLLSTEERLITYYD